MPSCDLQAVSIDPIKPSIKRLYSTTIRVNMKNNGPDVLPKGEAKVHITVDGRFVYKPKLFKPFPANGRWKLELIKVGKDMYEVFAVNSKDLPVGELGFPGFQFVVQGKAVGVCSMTLASSLSGNATSSDNDGNNQSVSCSLEII